jgi:hypothetical protein
MKRRMASALKPMLSCTVVLLATTSCTAPSAPPLAACPAGLQPIPPLTAPKLPVGESRQFTGTAQVRFVIDRAGNVHAPIIVSDALRSVGRNRGDVAGHHEAIIATVMAWRYPAQAEPCRIDVPFEIKLYEGGDGALPADTSGNP